MAKKVKWRGSTPNRCNLCGCDLKREEHFYDFKTKSGPWAMGCERCFKAQGFGLGIGKGQKYKTATLEQVKESAGETDSSAAGKEDAGE